MNDLMSGGLHRLWKRDFVAALNPPRGDQAFRLIDVAGGTGDIALRFAAGSGANATATICDISPEMLDVGRRRVRDAGFESRISLVEGNAETLPFDRSSFDAYTIAFGIRNVTHIDAALKEAFRVLRPGGRFLCLEFSQCRLPILDTLYDFHSFEIIPRLGQLAAGDAELYRYLVESIRKFPAQEPFADMIRAAGFERVTYRDLTGGIAAIHSGWKTERLEVLRRWRAGPLRASPQARRAHLAARILLNRTQPSSLGPVHLPQASTQQSFCLGLSFLAVAMLAFIDPAIDNSAVLPAGQRAVLDEEDRARLFTHADLAAASEIVASVSVTAASAAAKPSALRNDISFVIIRSPLNTLALNTA